MSRLRALAALGGVLAGLLAGGCASSDVSQDARLGAQVAEGLPVGTPAASMIVRAFWFPKANGASSTGPALKGVLALAGDKLYFLAWNDQLNTYDTQQSVAFLPAIKVEVVRNGLTPLLVIESKNMSFDAFELMQGGSVVPDAATTQALFERLQDLRAKNPPPDPQ
ncbi:MAG TPA: hypothetical protein VHV47_07990 [Opitutaceae bacterium]|jgi:hypothetical protein|nr:hypothetical protein [Opitutaceae bacterium]